MDTQNIQQAAQLLWNAWMEGSTLDNLPVSCRPVTIEEGYQIQHAIARLSGQSRFGWKIAATSKAGQAHIGVDGPIAGHLLSQRVYDENTRVPFAGNDMRVAEAEFAFRFGKALPPRPAAYGQEEVLAAVGSLHPAIEIPNSRYRDFVTVGAAQLIADNACAHYFVLGAAAPDTWRQTDLGAFALKAEVKGKLIRDGKGANALGDPRIALTWLVNELSRLGIGVAVGEVVTTGTCVVPVEIGGGDEVRADFGALGSVHALIE